MNKRLITMLLAIVAVAAAVTGCGSSSDDSTEALAKSEFIKQGDAICEKGSKSLSEEAEDFAKENNIDTSKPTKKQQEEVIETVLAPALQGQADQLNELAAPSGDEDRAEAIFAALESGAEELEEDPGALLKSGSSPLDEANKLASEYGFKVCGQE